MKTLKNIKQITDLKYLNMYQATYETDKDKQILYNFVSRRNFENLNANGVKKVDAVRIVPYYKKDNKMYVVLIKEFRQPLNQFIFSTPAGLVDPGEESLDAAIRELGEEIGATVVHIEKDVNPSFSSAGMSDETIESYSAEIKLDKPQNLDENEEIEFFSVPFDELLQFVDTHQFGLQSALHLKMFYYKHK